MATIRLVNIVKRFGKVVAVNHLNLTINDKEFLVLLGPSGCGKTTTLRSIAGLEIVDEGEIWIDDRLVNNLRASDRDIAFVFQLYALYPHLTAYGNIAFPLETQGYSKKEIDERVRSVARILKIEHILNKRPSALSSGDMQRVALGRAMVRRPKAFLMDEPIGTLDAKFREVMRTELKRLHLDIGATTIYVTHDQVEAMSMGDRIAIMNEGVIQQVGKPGEVYDNPANLFVANFIGSPGMNFVDVHCVKSGQDTKAVLQSDESISFVFSKDITKKLDEKDGFSKKLVLGIRPEWINIDFKQKEGSVAGEIYVIEPLGASKIVDVKIGNDIVKARTRADFEGKVGDKVWVEFNEKKVHFFDKDTGNSLYFT
ncbi:MAG: ABC transporter ATP-binding protein [Spirochaetes bacterium]|nr:MAG: ABC transporter ATP-binding protein [Spirochaetota bacterium]